MPTNTDTNAHLSTSILLFTTSLATFLTGFLLGIYSIRGYLIPPSLAEERRRNLHDPVESEESDVDEDFPLDHAPNWINGKDADRRDGLALGTARAVSGGVQRASDDESDSEISEECKLVLVVRTDLGMTKGKIAAQCGHATLACYKALSRSAVTSPLSPAARILRKWETLGQAKIALQTKSEDDIMELLGIARSLGLTAQVIQDAGRTQIESGSYTVLGIGPGPRSLVDRVTGHLKLL